jgi:hypothetical protein
MFSFSRKKIETQHDFNAICRAPSVVASSDRLTGGRKCIFLRNFYLYNFIELIDDVASSLQPTSRVVPDDCCFNMRSIIKMESDF